MANPVEAAMTSSAANALSGTTDPGTGAVYNTIGQSPYYTAAYQKEAIWNRIMAMANDLRVVKDGTLTCGVFAGRFNHQGATATYAGSTGNALTNATTNYVYLTSAGVLTINTTGFPAAAHIPLATILTAAGTFAATDVTDMRGAACYATSGQQELTSGNMPLLLSRNANGTVMDGTGGAGLFKIVTGGWGVGTLIVQGEDAQSNTKTDTLCYCFQLPPDYIADNDVKVVVRAKYAGTGTAGGTKTIDANVYELTADGAVGSDICATSAITLTSSFADCTFVLTDTALAPGDRLMILIQTALQETGGSATLYAQMGSISVQYDRAVGA